MKRLLLIGVCIIFIACQKKQTTTTSLLNYLPNNALLVVKSSAFETLQDVENQFLGSELLSAIFPDFFKTLNDFSPNTNGQLSFHPEGKDKLSYLLISHQKPQSLDSVVADTIVYNKTKMLQLKTNPQTYYATWDSLHIYSPSKLLVEQSIRLRNTPAAIDAELQKLYSNTKEASTFFVHKNIAPYFNTLFKNTAPLPWNQWSNWTAFVPSINKNGLSIHAYGVLPKNGTSKLSPIANQVSSLQNIAAHIPSSSKSIQAFAFDFVTFSKAAKRFQVAHNLPETTLDSLLIDAQQIAQVKLGNNSIIVITSEQEPEELTNQLVRQSSAQYSIGNQTLFELTTENHKKSIAAPLIYKGDFTHAAYVNEHIYLGTAKTALESVLYALEKDDVLANNNLFEQYSKNLPSRSSLWAWAAPTHFENNLKKTIPAIAKKDFGAFRQADYVGTLEGDVFYINLSLQQPNEGERSSQAVEGAGTITFETPIIWGPYAVKNHITQELEWVVQDEEYNLYLLNVYGKEVWKKPLDGAILGSVQQVDLYRNKRLQLAFTTTKSFQVLDRNGKTVKGFTKSGMGSASTLSVFDYDKQRDYRIVLSSGKSLAMYDRRMKKVSGWRRTKLMEVLAYPPKHIRIGNRDYIALTDKSGKGELLGRTGKTRIKIPTDIKFSQEIYPYKSGFVSIDNKNRLVQINTAGKVTKTALPFETQYTLAANKNTLVTQTENQITINNQLVELDFGVYAQPKIQVVNNRTYILVWDNQSGKVYVFNRDAKLLESFPVSGEHWAMLGQGSPNTAIYLAARNNKQELRFYRMP